MQVPGPDKLNRLALEAQIAELQAERAVLKSRLDNICLLTGAMHGKEAEDVSMI